MRVTTFAAETYGRMSELMLDTMRELSLYAAQADRAARDEEDPDPDAGWGEVAEFLGPWARVLLMILRSSSMSLSSNCNPPAIQLFNPPGCNLRLFSPGPYLLLKY